MLIGYARVSKADRSQSLDLQRDAVLRPGSSAQTIPGAPMTLTPRLVQHAGWARSDATRRCCMNTLCRWGGVARTSLDPPQEPHYGNEVEGSSHV